MVSAPATQKPIELILARQLASYLAMPIFLVDAAGTLVFCNEPAERIVGRRPTHDDEIDHLTAAATSAARPDFRVTAGAEGAAFELG